MSFEFAVDNVEVDHWTYVRSTPKAVLIREAEDGSGTRLREEWIPKSQLRDGTDDFTQKKEGDQVLIVIPGWLAEERDML